MPTTALHTHGDHELGAVRTHDMHAVPVVGARHGAPLDWVPARGLLAWLEKDLGLMHARDAVTERAQTIGAGAAAHG